jgi:hypothetical protein
MSKLTVFTRHSPDFTNNAFSFVIFWQFGGVLCWLSIDEVCDVMAVFVYRLKNSRPNLKKFSFEAKI